MSRKRSNFSHNLDVFNGGSMTIISDARLGKRSANTKYAVEATNIMQYEDGVWGPRPGTAYYGKAISGVGGIDHLAEYTKVDKSRELIALASDGKGYKSTDNGNSWTQITGATWTPGNQFISIQFKGQLWISNGVDPLVYYNGTQFNSFSAIADPSNAPTLSRGAGLSAGSYTYYLRYTANNNVGYTNPSPALTVTANKPRSSWNKTSNEYIDYTITAVPGATSYDLWLGDISGQEYYLGSTTDLTFRDFGDPVNSFREAPDDNTTAAPKITSMELSGNRMWATKDNDNPWRVYGTGTGQYLGYFSPFYGGFWIDLEKGGRFYPTAVVHYRTGKGDPVATVLCSSADGNGAIFQIDLTTITIGDVNATVPVAYKLVGSKGADAVGSVVKFGDNVGFLNKKGAFFLRNKEQLFNVLATDDMTSPIRNKYVSLNQKMLHKAVAYFSLPRIYFCVPSGDENDTTFVWDDERRNWTWGWTIGFKQIMEYTDSDGTTHLFGIRGNDSQIIEISENFLSDLGQPIVAQYSSPLIPVDAKDHRTQVRMKESIFEFGELRGSVNCAVLGRTKTTDIGVFGSGTISSSFSNSGVGDDYASDELASDTGDMPKTFSSSSRKKTIRPKKRFYAFKYRVSSNGVNNYWRLLSIQSHGAYVFQKSPGVWKKD